MEVGLHSFGTLVEFVARAMDGGQLRRTDPARVAAQWWTATHGYVMLELAGLHLPPDNPVEDVMRPLLTNLVVGLSPGAPGGLGRTTRMTSREDPSRRRAMSPSARTRTVRVA